MPQTDMVVMSAIYSIGDRLTPFDVPAIRVAVISDDNGLPFLSYKIDDRDMKDWLFIHARMSSYIAALSIATFGHFWLDDRIYHEGQVVWERPRTVRLVVQKEGDPHAPDTLESRFAVRMVDINYHVATHYPQVWGYHDIGLYLLRTSYPGLDFNREIMLNFFKIGEIVTASLLNVKPELRDIQQASAELAVPDFTPGEIGRFYKVRSRDAAHDWLQAEPIDRELVVDCKMWAECMVVKDWMKRGVELVKRGPQRILPERELPRPPFGWERPRRGRR